MSDSEIFDRYYNLSLRFLSYRPRSEKEVVDYLKKKKLSEGTIAQIMQRLTELRFVNDLEFARFWLEHRKKGLNLIKIELNQKGISRENIEHAISELDIKEKESKLINKLIEKKLRILSKYDKREAEEKIIAFLMRKGFDYETIKKHLKQFEFYGQ
jgi:regulatory protein